MTEQNKNLEKKRSVFFQIGMITALSVVLFAFEWTSREYDTKYTSSLEDGELIEDLINPVIIKKEKASKPKPKKKTITNDFKIVEKIMKEEETEPEITAKPVKDIDPTPIIDPVTLASDDDDPVEDPVPIALVEIQPYYDDCYNPLNREEQSLCSYAKIREHIQNNLRIPFVVKETGISGKTWVSFIVDEQGQVKEIKILKGIHKSMDKEAIRIIKSLPRLNPASQQGKKVKVQYQIPINVVIN